MDTDTGTPRPDRPLLFLDVDGPLIPFGGTGGYPVYDPQGPADGAPEHPLLSRIDPGLGPRLAALPCELVWATTWEDDANLCVAPRLGLPQLPVVHWPEPSDEDGRGGTHWKTPGLVSRAAGRAFVWVDDEIGAADRRWVRAHHTGAALLHRVDPRTGLGDADFAALEGWLRGFAGTGSGRPGLSG
ncbi:hypothetical protein [Streptomyces sp. NBC_00503]|uniref:hypothetical protein n=1 Tax=Streptomyces sp. NBC_00503 TaxID=2903659 RepID=UPI002E802D02|nr:hypothetical protein [Streptomyces sp. NBC_00503]WUD85137.1 hypothetical protein OG490_33795 [Streptomyces sp. NBC_00503]